MPNQKIFKMNIDGIQQNLKNAQSLNKELVKLDKNIKQVGFPEGSIEKAVSTFKQETSLNLKSLDTLTKVEVNIQKLRADMVDYIIRKITSQKKEDPKTADDSEKAAKSPTLFSQITAAITKGFTDIATGYKKGEKDTTDSANIGAAGKFFTALVGLFGKNEKKKDATTPAAAGTVDTKKKQDGSENKEAEKEAKEKIDKITEGAETSAEKWVKIWGKVAEETAKYSAMTLEISNATFEILTSSITSKKEDAEAALKDTTEKYNKVVEQRKKSTQQINDLENKAANARGGRAIVLQEQISKEMANKQKLVAQEKQLAEKKDKAEKDKTKAENREKRLKMQKQLVEASINVAQGITKAWAAGPLLGPILAAIVAAAGAIQLTVMTKKMSQYADGGLLRGKRHNQGGMRIQGSNIEVEGGEYVINRQSTRRNLGLINYINAERRELKATDVNSYFDRNRRWPTYKPLFASRLEEGGQIPTFATNSDMSNRQLLEAIGAIKIEPHVSVTDINRMQNAMVQADQWVGIQ